MAAIATTGMTGIDYGDLPWRNSPKQSWDGKSAFPTELGNQEMLTAHRPLLTAHRSLSMAPAQLVGRAHEAVDGGAGQGGDVFGG